MGLSDKVLTRELNLLRQDFGVSAAILCAWLALFPDARWVH